MQNVAMLLTHLATGSNSWDPTSLTVQGKDTINGEIRRFSDLHPLTEKDNKWIFARKN